VNRLRHLLSRNIVVPVVLVSGVLASISLRSTLARHLGSMVLGEVVASASASSHPAAPSSSEGSNNPREASSAPVTPSASSSSWPDDAFDWKLAKCPAITAESAAFVLSPVVPRVNVPLRTLVALQQAPNGPVEVALRAEKSTLAVVRLSSIEVLDQRTFGFDGSLALPSRFVTWMLRVGPDVVACRRLAADDEVERGGGPKAWGAEAEALYSLWAGRLLSFERWESFDGLASLTRESSRNLLLGRLGSHEDDEPTPLGKKSDCADFPLSLRAYFSWKLELPFGVFREPATQNAPRVLPSATAHDATMGREFDLLLDGHEPRVPRALFSKKLYRLQNGISSGLLRTERSTEDTNLYPIALEQSALRPGSPYVDPFTHVSVLAGWEHTDNGAQRLWVADAQPSGLITIHPYVPGAIVFRPGKASAGFKWVQFGCRSQ
jgi:hypothetical protein